MKLVRASEEIRPGKFCKNVGSRSSNLLDPWTESGLPAATQLLSLPDGKFQLQLGFDFLVTPLRRRWPQKMWHEFIVSFSCNRKWIDHSSVF